MCSSDNKSTDWWMRRAILRYKQLQAERARIAKIPDTLTAHLYACDQSSDPCYAIEPAEGETWHGLAARKAHHVHALIAHSRGE